MKRKTTKIQIVEAFAVAFQKAFPIMAGFLFLGLGYGIYMTGCGFSPWWPACMAAAVYAGSVEFIVVGLLLSTFNPLYAFLLTLLVNGRHIFYGISILNKYQGTGWKKLFLVSGLSDEAFSLNYMTEPQEGILKDWYMLWVTLLLYLSWVGGAALGGFAGAIGISGIKGIEFVMPALFIVIFISQWQKESSHTSSIAGWGAAIVCLLIFGRNYFLLPALLLVFIAFSVQWVVKKQNKNKL
ncbi:AzlC family ABC transporter permease [Phocaeicola plebeius]|uniref:AzlC family ABC transporter permease n=1 Tax=Phocaeicola plebeius TaxID=310297 RepID=UPI0026F1F75C|nr:AzlC family ABC transporter permease [Phocaeicola plebeius]